MVTIHENTNPCKPVAAVTPDGTKYSNGSTSAVSRVFGDDYKVRRKATERFLELMTGTDLGDHYYWRRFDDKKGGAYPNTSGPLDKVYHELEKPNDYDGIGIFLVCNRGGQRKTEIKTVRAFFIDVDSDDDDGRTIEDMDFHGGVSLSLRGETPPQQSPQILKNRERRIEGYHHRSF